MKITAGVLILCTVTGLSAHAETSVPMQLCFGGGDHPTTGDVERKIEAEREFVKYLQRGKATSHETYVRWSMIEPAKGTFDFKFQDAILAVDQAAGLKWVPFIVLSPAYTLPDWFYHGPEDVGYVCLEHGKRSDIQTLWNPHLRPHIKRAYAAFGKHYAKNKSLESVLLGVSGNYGETLVPASNLDWTQDLHGPYHTHVGWWVGDDYAVADFRKRAIQEYKTVKALNRAWGTTFSKETDIRTQLPPQWPTTAARQFQAEWMLDSMTEYADFCMKTAKAALPKTDVYLVVGGHAPSYHGLDITAQTEAAAKRDCGIRITNEADPFQLNFPITRMVSSACRFYGTFFSYEPAGAISYKGVATRSFNATASGAKCLHWYENNVRETTRALEVWDRCRPLMRQREPVIDVAVFYPRRWMNLQGDEELVYMYQDFGAVRAATDYDFLDERLLNTFSSGKLKPYKYLLVREDTVADEISSRAVTRFLRRKDAPKGIFFMRGQPQAPDAHGWLQGIAKTVHPNDDYTSGIYHARFTDGSLLFLSELDVEADLSKTHPQMVKNTTVLRPREMLEVRE
ncbi:MAG: beta-galactosidase [Candidatus Sumerlaeaceae bacterium]